MSRINFLPPWVETTLQPAFYDKESGTVLQQTARMYAKVNQLVRSVNEQNETIADYIQQFIDLRNYVDDYFENLDVQEEINNKLEQMVTDGSLQQLIDNYFSYLNERISELNTTVNNKITAQNTEISTFETGVNGRLATQDGDIQTLVTRMDTFSSLTEGSTTGDAELIDGRTSFDGRVFSNIGDNIREYQDKGFADITATLTAHASHYIGKTNSESSSNAYTWYELPTKEDKYYLIDSVCADYAPQVVFHRNYCIPDEASIVSGGSYNHPIVVKGTGGIIRVNNANSNTALYIGEEISNYVPSDLSKYFTDVTANTTKTEGKYITTQGRIYDHASFNLYEFTPTVGKRYRIFTAISTNAYAVYQADGVHYPIDSEVTSIPNFNVPTYYDVFCYSTNSFYMNEQVSQMGNNSFKIYESKMSYYVPSDTNYNINADLGAFDKAFFIGDSLTYGQTYTASNASYRNYYNYPHYLKDLLQINDITEVARSGATAQSWWNSFADTINQTECIYFIWLGTNDTYTDTVSTDCAGSDYTQFANNATGNLGKIVGKCASMTNSKIVLLNNFTTVGTKAVNNKVITDLATKYGCMVVDVDTDIVRDSGYHTAYNGYFNSVHFNNQGHNYIANLVAQQLSNYMNTNKGSYEIFKEHA